MKESVKHAAISMEHAFEHMAADVKHVALNVEHAVEHAASSAVHSVMASVHAATDAARHEHKTGDDMIAIHVATYHLLRFVIL